ncbi:hypothetical protein NL676_018523 [Syzygium grande]|nr:hypothetical protein NL676_018523 [Syzygium grande]
MNTPTLSPHSVTLSSVTLLCDIVFSDKFTCSFCCNTFDDSGASRFTELALDQAGYSGSLASVSWNLPFLQTISRATTSPDPSSAFSPT